MPASPSAAAALLPTTITRKAFLHILSKYTSVRDARSQTLAQEKKPKNGKAADLSTLDEQRYHIIPAAISARRATTKQEQEGDGGAHITREELATLVRWKLTHGTFRPTLVALTAQNTEEHVFDATRRGLQDGNEESETVGPTAEDIKQRLQSLCELKGVGPATASLIMSAARPRTVPFFSDELFRWCCLSDPADRDLGAWRTKDKIRYTQKEYLQLLDRVCELLRRLVGSDDEKKENGGVADHEIGAVECEKVAYVLGHRWEECADETNATEKDIADAAKPEADAREAKEEELIETMEQPSKRARPKRGQKREAAQETPEQQDVQPMRKRRTRQT